MDELIKKSDAIEAIKQYALRAYDINIDNSKEFAGYTLPENYCEGLYEATEIIEDVAVVKAAPKQEVVDEFVKILLDAFPEGNRDAKCPAIYYEDFEEIVEAAAEKMKGDG